MTLAVPMFPKVMVCPLYADDLTRVDDFLTRFHALKPKPIRAQADMVEVEWQRAGKLVEVAVGGLLDLPVDWDVYVNADGGDFTLRDGRRLSVRGIQVHSSMDEDYTLLYREGERVPDVLALGLVTPAVTAVWIAGTIDWARFQEDAKPMTGWAHQGSSQPLGVARSRLHPFKTLYDAEHHAASEQQLRDLGRHLGVDG